MVRRVLVFLGAAVVVGSITTAHVLSGQQGSTPKNAQPTAAKAPAPAKPAAAPDVSKMPLVNVTVVQLKPDLLLEWQEFQKSETIPALQKAGIKQRSVFATVIGPGFEYATLTPLANFAERDGDNPIVKALGEDGARAYGLKARRFVASQRTYVVRVRTDLSFNPDPSAHMSIGTVSTYSIAAGHGVDFENYIKNDLTPAHKQLKTAGFTVYQGLFGGEGGSFVIGTGLHNFAELDKGSVFMQAYGAARAAAIQQKLAGVVTRVERVVVREVPELGFRPRMVSENR